MSASLLPPLMLCFCEDTFSLVGSHGREHTVNSKERILPATASFIFHDTDAEVLFNAVTVRLYGTSNSAEIRIAKAMILL